MANASTAGPRDRRTARAERTRAAIIDAHIGLLAEGVLQPTGREIASRAGVSSRSLWVHLTDLEELFTATAAETLARQEARSTRTFRSRRSARRWSSRGTSRCRVPSSPGTG